jgi:protein tyrosine phosphatase (PTP) superfamily phosphohydrolase (DUF442 family)
MRKKAPNKPLPIVVGSLVLPLASLAGAQMDSAHGGPVMNYHRVNDRLVTGGHLLDGGAATLKEQGVSVVINLRDDSPTDEQQQFAEQGIEWFNIPVAWRNPKHEDFRRFREIMSEHQDDHVLVQCAVNYRASAMTYLYQVTVEGVPADTAAVDMNAIWDPNDNDTWRQYIDDVEASGQ